MPSFTPYGFGPAPGADDSPPAPPSDPIPVADAEALLATLPGIISARLVAARQGGVSEVHVLTGADVAPRQTVHAVESALFARYGVRVDNRRISVATTTGLMRRSDAGRGPADVAPGGAASVTESALPGARVGRPLDARRLYFEDVEARRSARGGVSCRVVLRRGGALASEGDALVEGEAESPGTMRVRSDEVAARAALDALARGEAGVANASFALEGSARVMAFGREFVLVGVVARQGRGATLLTGSAEVRDGSAETAAVLAILDATNRWVARCAPGGGGAARAA